MDVTIPSHNLKRFAASITCLGKIGKDLYVSFDPLDGLTLSSLNEAKSAYSKFHFEPGFFDRCSCPPCPPCQQSQNVPPPPRLGRRTGGANGGNVADGGDNDDYNEFEDEFDSRYVCRVPVRSVHSILRPRKGVFSLRIRSEGKDESGVYFGLFRRLRRGNKRQRGGGGQHPSGGRGQSGRSGRSHDREKGSDRHKDDKEIGNDSENAENGQNDDGDDDDDDDDEEGRKKCRRNISYSSRRLRKRGKNAHPSTSNYNDNGNNEEDEIAFTFRDDKMMLSFEFYIERPANPANSLNSAYPNGNNTNNPYNTHTTHGGIYRVLHKIGVTDANGITLSASTSERSSRSEIVSRPKLFLRLLDPLRRTAEVALTVDDELRVVTATSFHPGEVGGMGSGGGNGGNAREENAVLLAAAARNAVLKTETSTGCDEFDEYDFRNNRGKKRRRRRKEESSDSSEEEVGNEREKEDFDFEKENDVPPPDVNKKVILVFGVKEAKAMLQFCSQTNSAYHDDGEALAILSFHWGGKPFVIETDGDFFSAELVLATLHHAMIASNIAVGGAGR